MDVVDDIERIPTGRNDRPQMEVIMEIIEIMA